MQHGGMIMDRRPRVAEALVEPVRQCVHGGRLVVAGDDEASAPMILQIAGAGPHPASLLLGEVGIGSGGGQPELPREGCRQRQHPRCDERQCVVSDGAGQPWRAFHDVQARHFRERLAAPREITRVAEAAGHLRKKIAVQLQHDVGLFQPERHISVPSQCQAGPTQPVIGVDRLPLMPFGPRILLQQHFDLVAQPWRGQRRRQQPQALAPVTAPSFAASRYRLCEIRPADRLVLPSDGPRAIRIEQLHRRRLHDGVRRTQGGRVIGVSFDLGRAALV